MSSVLFLGGIFNVVDPIFGLPLYIYSWIALLIIIGLTWAGMYYLKWKPLEPMHGLYYALKNTSTVAFIFNELLVGELVAERESKCIFNYAAGEHGEDYEIDIPEGPYDRLPLVMKLKIWYYTKSFYYPTKYLRNITPVQAIVYKIAGVNKDVEIAMFLEGGKWERSASVVCAGVPVDIVVDMDRWTIPESRQHAAIIKSARRWNEANPTDQVHSYQKYQKYLLENKIACPPELQITAIVPWQRIDAAFPLDLDENEWAGKKWQKSKDDDEEDAGAMMKIAMYLLVAGLAVDVLILLFRFILALVK